MEAKTALIDFYRVLEIDEGPWEESKGESDTIGGFPQLKIATIKEITAM